jgi:hypothetical protein
MISDDCHVDVERALDPHTQRIWERKIHSYLQETLKHAIEDSSSLECFLASTRVDKIMEPTILVTCLNSAHKNIVEEKLRKASCIPSYLRHRVLPFEVILCATADSCVVPEPRLRTGRRDEISRNKIDEMEVLFASACRVTHSRDHHSA